MKKFLDEDFLLDSGTAVKLYNDYAKDMPIFDYHCHLNSEEIYRDKKFNNITEAWLYGDHYKWRAMRADGVDEKYITGDAGDFEKFMAWAGTVPDTIGNPLYIWTHLELQRYFGIDDVLNEKTALKIWEETGLKLQRDDFSVRNLIKRSNVKVLCTTDDPLDSLEYHKKLEEDRSFDVKVLPAFRPDKALNINGESFRNWAGKLGEITNRSIADYDAFLSALEDRINYFHETGCRLSDHALLDVPFEDTTYEEVSFIFKRALNGEKLGRTDEDKYKTYTLCFLGKKYCERGWAMQLHIGALRNNNTKMFKKLGPDTGYDSIGDSNFAGSLSRLLNSMAVRDKLPKTILYDLNPRDNYVLASMIGNFQEGGIPGKLQLGSGWWFNDNKDGMIDQMKALYNCGLLSRFIGMLTDSRSFLSYTRHEYFRRVLCSLLGGWAENGEVPLDYDLLGKIVQDICFNNAKKYFGVEI